MNTEVIQLLKNPTPGCIVIVVVCFLFAGGIISYFLYLFYQIIKSLIPTDFPEWISDILKILFKEAQLNKNDHPIYRWDFKITIYILLGSLIFSYFCKGTSIFVIGETKKDITVFVMFIISLVVTCITYFYSGYLISCMEKRMKLEKELSNIQGNEP